MKRASVAAALVCLWSSSAMAQSGIEIGLLDCVVEGGTGFIIGSTKNVSCTYTPAGSAGASESYSGVINKVGIDIGTTNTTLIQWAVLAPSRDIYSPGALAGDYVGASAEATAAAGVGVNVLVGGSERSFTLQPVSVQAQTGVNIAIGVTEFRLRSN